MSKNVKVVISVLTVMLLSTAVYSAPKLDFNTNEFDFGYSPQNSKLSYPFWLKSSGDDVLKIVKVIPGCGCTKAPLDKDQLVPGDSAKLEVIFSTKRYRNQIVKTPRVETNEGANPKNVTIKTFVVANPDETFPVVISPYKLDLSQYGNKERNHIEFTIKNVSDKPMNTKMIYHPNDFYSISLPETIEAGSEATAVLKLNTDKLTETFEKSFTIEFSDEKQSRFTIPVIRKIFEQAAK